MFFHFKAALKTAVNGSTLNINILAVTTRYRENSLVVSALVTVARVVRWAGVSRTD